MKIFFLFFAFLLQISTISATGSSDPLEQAKRTAISTNKLILVDFTAVWCGPCKRMEEESWSKQDVQELSSYYVFLKIDIDRYRNIANRYNIKSIPYVFILDPNGEIIHETPSYQTKRKLMGLLKDYAINLDYLQSAYIINYKKETVSSLFRLARKQQEFAIFLDKNQKNEFLSLSRSYINKAEKRLKKEKNKAYTQEAGLLYLHSYLIGGNYDKVKKKLKKAFKEDQIEDMNKSLYYFLNYMISLNDDDNQASDEYLSRLNEQKSKKIYLKEISLLSNEK